MDLPCQTLCGNITRVHLSRTVGRRLPYVIHVGTYIRHMFVEQPVYVGLLHLDLPTAPRLNCGTAALLSNRPSTMQIDFHESKA